MAFKNKFGKFFGFGNSEEQAATEENINSEELGLEEALEETLEETFEETSGDVAQQESLFAINESAPQQSLFDAVDELALEREPSRAVFKFDGGISDFVKNINE